MIFPLQNRWDKRQHKISNLGNHGPATKIQRDSWMQEWTCRDISCQRITKDILFPWSLCSLWVSLQRRLEANPNQHDGFFLPKKLLQNLHHSKEAITRSFLVTSKHRRISSGKLQPRLPKRSPEFTSSKVFFHAIQRTAMRFHGSLALFWKSHQTNADELSKFQEKIRQRKTIHYNRGNETVFQQIFFLILVIIRTWFAYSWTW